MKLQSCHFLIQLFKLAVVLEIQLSSYFCNSNGVGIRYQSHEELITEISEDVPNSGDSLWCNWRRAIRKLGHPWDLLVTS